MAMSFCVQVTELLIYFQNDLGRNKFFCIEYPSLYGIHNPRRLVISVLSQRPSHTAFHILQG